MNNNDNITVPTFTEIQAAVYEFDESEDSCHDIHDAAYNAVPNLEPHGWWGVDDRDDFAVGVQIGMRIMRARQGKDG